MSRACMFALAAVAVYQVVALRTKKVPPITELEKAFRLHFRPARPHCVGCQCNGRVPQRVVYRQGAWP
jgi:hypothetical protein